MKLGKVTEKLKLEKQNQCLKEEKILMVEMEGSTVAALDTVGARPGEQVLVVMGHAASRYSMDSPVDAVITAVVKEG